MRRAVSGRWRGCILCRYVPGRWWQRQSPYLEVVETPGDGQFFEARLNVCFDVSSAIAGINIEWPQVKPVNTDLVELQKASNSLSCGIVLVRSDRAQSL